MKAKIDISENNKYDLKEDIKYLLLVGVPSGVLFFFILKCVNLSMLF